MDLTAKNIFQFQGQNQYMKVLGEMVDISNLCQFVWYEQVYFRQKTAAFTFQKEQLVRCLGPTKNYGSEFFSGFSRIMDRWSWGKLSYD